MAGSLAATNLASYAFTIMAARLLGPVRYGALAAIMALILVINVVSLALQATSARRVALGAATSGAEVRGLDVPARRAALALGALVLLLSPIVTTILALDTWLIGVLLALGAVALTRLGGYLGILQGSERWFAYAAAILASGAGRLLVAGGLLLLWPSVAVGALGVVLGIFLPLVVAGRLTRQYRRPVIRPPRPGGSTSVKPAVFLREALRGAHVLFAFFALTSIDILLARATLPVQEAGLYAGGLILVKAVLFLPSFVSIIAFPRLVAGGSTHLHLWGLAAVLAMGAGAVGITVAASPLVVQFVGGDDYSEVESRLWMFAALGAVLGGIQMLVTTALARDHRSAVWWVWAAVAAIAALSPAAASATSLLTVVMMVNTALLAILVLVTRADVVREPVLDL